MPEQVIGIAWYYENQWDKVRNYSKDRQGMAKKYSDWLSGAEKSVKDFESRGMKVHKVYIDVDMLIAWARRKRLDIDGHTRSDYVNHLLASSYRLTKDV